MQNQNDLVISQYQREINFLANENHPNRLFFSNHINNNIVNN